MHQYQSLKKQRGVVIVVALFFVALAATMAYFMVTRIERDTYRTQLLLRYTQAELYSAGSIDWAKEQLRNNLARQNPNKIVDIVPIQSPVNEVNGYRISSTITDMQARMNINNLVADDAKSSFKRLLQIVYPKINEQKAQELTLAIANWVTPGSLQNEYNQYYLELSPPYRAAQAPMASASELVMVKGMTPAIYQALQPFVVALPQTTSINLLTAPPEIIASLGPGISIDTARTIAKSRNSKMDPQAFKESSIIKNHHIPVDKTTLISRYFLVETIVTIENQPLVIYTLLERNDSQKDMNVIWQTKSVPAT